MSEIFRLQAKMHLLVPDDQIPFRYTGLYVDAKILISDFLLKSSRLIIEILKNPK